MLDSYINERNLAILAVEKDILAEVINNAMRAGKQVRKNKGHDHQSKQCSQTVLMASVLPAI